MTQKTIDVWVEPIEQYLREIICADKLALYQQGIELFKLMQRLSLIENLNSICNNLTNESPSDVVDEVHRYMEQYTIDLLGEFDIVAVVGDLPFLLQVLDIVHRLDSYEEHETLINTLQGWSVPLDALYQAVNLLMPIDEDRFYQSVRMCSLALIEQLLQTHRSQLEKQYAQILPETIDLSLTKKLIQQDRGLIIGQMFEDDIVSTQLPLIAITVIAKDYFKPLDIKTSPKRWALELIGVYSLSGLQGDALITGIKEQIYFVCGDDQLMLSILSVLGSVYVEVSS